MNLTLVAISLNDQPLSQPITAVFDSRGGTIGRADHNTMALPDPQRHISRLQAEIVAHGATYIIRNVGASNPIVVNGRNLANGDTAALSQNEQVRMGGYLLKAQLGPASASDASAYAHRPQAWAQASATASPAPAAGIEVSLLNAATSLVTGAESGPASDPFADLWPPPAGVHPQSPAVAASAPAASMLPDDFDVFADPRPSRSADLDWAGNRAAGGGADERSAGQQPSAVHHPDPLADIVQNAAGPSSIDELFGLGVSADADSLARFLEGAVQGQKSALPGAPPGLSTDPLALFVAAPALPPTPAPGPQAGTASPPLQRTVPVPMAQADNLPAVHAAFVPPRTAQRAVPVEAARPSSSPLPPLPPPPSPSPPSPRATPPAQEPPAARPEQAAAASSGAPDSGVTPHGLWAAFCNGAGIESIQPSAAAEQQMHDLGRILRSAINGTLQLMAVRASTKHELRAGVTIIQPRNNNPLKFSPDAVAALSQLLQPPVRGFLDGPAAMDDAMHDLVGHTIGTVAGLRAAVEGMLDRFAPPALEAKLSSHSVFDNLLPAARKARLWDLYVQHHRAIHEEAQEDFHTLFGKAFLTAYEQQIERLKKSAAHR